MADDHDSQVGRAAVLVRDVAVTYEIVEDRVRRNLKSLVAQGLNRTPPRKVEAVRGVRFDLHEGEGLGLIGANGAGKTTLLRAIAGLVPVTDGRILARSEPVLLGVGAALHPQLSGRRNVYLGGTALGMTRDQVDARFDDIVDFAGVREFIEMPLRAYSSGMGARLRFAIASAVEPDILLIDEALAVGDAAFKRKSNERMREVIAQAGTLVLVSHSLGSIEELCSRVIWLSDGQVKMDGPTDDVLTAYRDATTP